MSNVSNLVKSIQDIMRKDAGTYGDAQRLEQLGWMFFLKIFDDREKEIEQLRDKYKSPLPRHLRWSNWAADEEGMTGEELLDFVNNTLLPKLKSLAGAGDRIAGLIRMAFDDANNYMKNGTLMRQVINKINGIDFNKSSDRHMFGDIYEKLLKDLQSAGNAGEFYTPRAVTQFIVEQVNPRLGETILDPACGTGGFLVCAIEHLRKQAKTEADEHAIQECFQGIEKKHLPHLLCMTNLLLHGIDVPWNVRHDNTLARPLRDWRPSERVDVVVTNPPFGGMEEDGIEGNFPAEFRTRETAALFLVLIVKVLKPGGRAGLVLPEGTLFGEGVTTRIKEALLNECDVHTIVRLPKGVFEPYTDIATNLVFLEKGRPTREIWFYEHPLPEHRSHLKGKSYSATDNLQYSEFEALRQWWTNRQDNEQAWKMSADDLRDSGFDLAQNHPKHQAINLPLPVDIVATVRRMKSEGETILAELDSEVSGLGNIAAPLVPLAELIRRRTETIRIDDDQTYTRPRVQLHFRGALVRDQVRGTLIGSKLQTLIRSNDLILSRIDAHNGAMALAPEELNGAIATNDFPVFAIQTDRVLPEYLRYCLFQPAMIKVYKHLSRGSTNRRRLNMGKFLELRIPVPDDIDVQIRVAEALERMERGISRLRERLGGIEEELQELPGAALHHVLG
jgi:type I restriction enzyme M protein